MRTDTITLSNIKQDFIRLEKYRYSTKLEYRIVLIVLSLIVVLLTLYLTMTYYKMAIILIAFLLFAIYQAVRLIFVLHERSSRKKAILSASIRSDISISKEKLSSITEEAVREFRILGFDINGYRIANFYNFTSGKSWRVPQITHYKWSLDYKMSPRGLMNLSLVGDEFYYVSLQANHEIAYIYPCEYFAPDEPLRI